MIQHAFRTTSEIHWEFKSKNRLLIICMISEQKTSTFADSLANCSQIKEVNQVHNYDSGLGAISATMIEDYNSETANEEIKETFNNL